MRKNDEMIEWLEAYKGVKEVPGDANNPLILELARIQGLSHITADAQNWCGVALGFAVLGAGGIPPANYTIASNWRTWGAPVFKPIRGDVCVIKGPNPDDFIGWHVGLYVTDTDDSVILLGGNQVDEIREFPYAKSRVDSFRRIWTTRN